VLTLEPRPVQPTQRKSDRKPSRELGIGRASAEEIRPLAYWKWEQAGCPVSDGVEFWLAAETEILRGKRR
jgi:hypothetical protein